MRRRVEEDRIWHHGRITVRVSGKGRFDEYVSLALEAIPDDVGVGELEVPIRHDSSLRSAGCFDRSDRTIAIRTPAQTPALTVLHELGHALDFIRYGAGSGFGSEQPVDDLRDVMAAIGDTDRHEALRQDRFVAQLRRNEDAKRELARLLEGRERFARGFAQWVASVPRADDLLRRELARRQPQKRQPLGDRANSSYSDHWTDADFSAVRDAFDRLFLR